MSRKPVSYIVPIFALLLVGVGVVVLKLSTADQINEGENGERSRVSNRLAGRNTPSFELGETSLVRTKSNTLRLGKHATVSLEDSEIKVFHKPLFKIQEKPLGELSMTHHSFSAIELEYQNGGLQDFLESDATSLIVPLEKEREVEVRFEEIVYRGEQTVSLRGQVGDDSTSEALIVFHDGAISGSIAFYSTNEHYEMGLSGDGYVAVRKLDPDSYTEGCACEHADLVDEMELDTEPEVLGEVSADAIAGDIVDYSIDSVIGYDSGSRVAEGGVAGIEARIILAVDRVNTVLQNSGVDNTEMVLLGMVEDPDYVFPGASGMLDEVSALNSSNDGSLDIVSDLRAELGADHQGFILQGSDGSAGIAYRPGRSMVVARTAMSSVNFTFVHELGHNIGCRHGWGDTDYGTSSSNYGWRFRSADGTRNRTVMSYNGNSANWPRVPYFSTLLATYNGTPLGAVNGYDATGDSLVDQDLVTFTDNGTEYFGFNGSNNNLGARNAEYILANSRFVADNFNRPEIATMRVVNANREWLETGEENFDFSSTSVGSSVSHTFTISNIGGTDLTGLALNFTGANSSDFSVSTVPSTLVPYDAVSISVTHTSSGTGRFSGTLNILSNDSTTPTFAISLGGSVREEQVSLGDDFENGLGGWSDSGGYDFNWSRNSGSTRSNNTGPDSGDQDTWYIYTEASGDNHPSKTAGIEKEYDFSGLSEVALQFSYHMFGNHMGTLHIDVFNGSWQQSVWSISGEQQDSSSEDWKTALVDLSSYVDGQNGVRIRFRGVTGNGINGDIAIDQIKILAVSQSGGALENWYAQYGLTGSDATSLAEPMQDGVSNLEKYAFNMNPTEVGNYSVEAGTGESGLPLIRVVENGSSEVLQVEYLRRKNAGSISYMVLFGDTPGEDDGANYSESVIDMNATWERVIATDTQNTTTKQKRFATVKVVLVE